ncbi:hypothetical protein EVJ50_08485 [Synechococcus sp. RSCCF101]|uniref:FIST signal transduction protein n=1 Tax=Synechococcus sp. RSCCF101 TaxID=2511069 RepID=UPI0012458C3F|nr:FIST N-terminal domain-containing protein [Synechococcus sp. RSCCF101]QEY32252.1 hypothetical protein EVJ50_08485 [Synechococcus sp. RSCCF101]
MLRLPALDWLRGPTQGPWVRTALSRASSLDAAVAELRRQLKPPGPADLALVFVSSSFATDLPRLLPLLAQGLQSEVWLGCLGGGVVGTDAESQPQEVEAAPALSVMLLRLPGVRLHPFHLDMTGLPDLDGSRDEWHRWVGAPAEAARSMLLLIDPGASGINDLIRGLDYAYPGAVTLGGIAGNHAAAHGSLLHQGSVCTGAVGCLIDGPWRLDPVVAQGCRPIGPVFEIEQVERNVLLELSTEGSRASPVTCLQGVLADLTPGERDLVRHSLFLGIGQNDFRMPSAASASSQEPAFLVRNLIGVDPRNGAVAVAERIRVGQQVQFQLRESGASTQEAQSLLAAQRARLTAPPLAGLLFACLGRGQGLFQKSNGDVALAAEAHPDLPVAGAFCNGEIGPLGGSTHLHGYTACWAMVVPSPEESEAA